MGQRGADRLANKTAGRPAPVQKGAKRQSAWLGLGAAVIATVVLVAAFAVFQRGQEKGTTGGQTTSSAAAGKAAPSFNLASTTGGTVSLESFRGKQNVLLYWYEHAG